MAYIDYTHSCLFNVLETLTHTILPVPISISYFNVKVCKYSNNIASKKV